MIEKLKELYSRSKQEIKDLKEEQQGDRDDLLHTVRTQGYDLKFYKRMVQMLMKDDDIARIKMKSSYDDNTEDWVVPPFMLKAKEVTLPQLKKNGYDVMEQEKENRELAIEGDGSGSDYDDSEKDGPSRRNEGGLFSGAKNPNYGIRSSQNKAAIEMQRRADNASAAGIGGL